jgi:hypothetical protein
MHDGSSTVKFQSKSGGFEWGLNYCGENGERKGKERDLESVRENGRRESVGDEGERKGRLRGKSG